MKPDHDELLDELLGDSAAGGPSADAVLGLLRAEKARRQRHTLSTAGAGFMVLGLSAALLLRTEPAPQVAHRAPPAEPFPVKRVNDQEFLELLAQQDEPVALVKLPNGERRLLMLAHSVQTPMETETP